MIGIRVFRQGVPVALLLGVDARAALSLYPDEPGMTLTPIHTWEVGRLRHVQGKFLDLAYLASLDDPRRI